MQWLWAGGYEPAFDPLYRLFQQAGADRAGTNVATRRGLTMVAIALSLLAAIGLAGGAVSARGAMPGVHTFTTISVSLVVGFVVAPIIATFPLWTLMLSHIFIAGLEGITLRLVIGAFLAVGGVIAVALGGQL